MNDNDAILKAFKLRDGSDGEPVESRLTTALEYCTHIVHKYAGHGKIYILELDPKTLRARDLFTPVFQRRGVEEEQLVGWDTSDDDYQTWVVVYQSSPEAAFLIENRLVYNDLHGWPVSEPARKLRAMLLSRIGLSRPKLTTKRVEIYRDTLLAGLAKRVSFKFGFHLGASKKKLSNSSPLPVAGCTIAAAALYGFDVFVNATRADIIARRGDLPLDDAAAAGVFVPYRYSRYEMPTTQISPEYFACVEGLEDNLAKARNYFSR